jgi:hypothetical protein
VVGCRDPDVEKRGIDGNSMTERYVDDFCVTDKISVGIEVTIQSDVLGEVGDED